MRPALPSEGGTGKRPSVRQRLRPYFSSHPRGICPLRNRGPTQLQRPDGLQGMIAPPELRGDAAPANGTRITLVQPGDRPIDIAGEAPPVLHGVRACLFGLGAVEYWFGRERR